MKHDAHTPPIASEGGRRLVASSIRTMLVSVGILGLVYIGTGAWFHLGVAAVGVSTCMVALWLLPRWHPRNVAHLCVSIGFLTLLVQILGSGAIASPVLYWLIAAPLVGGMLMGIDGLLFWAGIVGVTVLGLLVAHMRDIDLTVDGGILSPVDHAAQFISLVAVLVNIFATTMRHRNDAVDALKRAISDLEAAVAAKTAAEAEVRAAMANKEQFIAQLSHELRNPLNGIIGTAELLGRTHLHPDQRELVDALHHSGHLVVRLLSDVLDASKLAAGAMDIDRRPFAVAECLEDAASMFASSAAEKGLVLLVHIEPSTPTYIVGDPDRMQQMAGNLVSNAVKFTQRGHVRVGAYYTNNRLRVEVTDTGPGISADSISRVFAPFIQVGEMNALRASGTGLGLSIVRGLAERMGGNAGAHSALGQGSTFWFEVEAKPASGPPLPAFPPGTLVYFDARTPVEKAMWMDTLVALGAKAIPLTAADIPSLPPPTETSGPIWFLGAYHHAEASAQLLRRRIGAVCVAVSPFGTHVSMKTTPWSGHIHLPVRRRTLLDVFARAASPVASHPTTPLRVLVADDSPVNRDILRRMCESAGHICDVVPDGAAAIEKCAAVSYDVVFLDLQMPHVDGRSAARALQQTTPQTMPRLVAITGEGNLDHNEIIHVIGFSSVLRKPLRYADIVATLHRHAGAVL